MGQVRLAQGTAGSVVWRGLVSILLWVILVSAGCSGTPESAGPTPTGTTQCRPLTDIPRDVSSSDPNGDGSHAAYVVEIDVSGRTVTWDPVVFLTGAAAAEAYQRENPGQGTSPPNDYYVVNEDPALRTSMVVTDACLTVFTSGDPNSGTKVPDLEAFSETVRTQLTPSGPRLSDSVFWISITSARISAIEQQWVP